MARAVASGTRADVALLAVSGLLSFAALALPANLRDPLASTLRRTFIAPLIALQRDAELGRSALVRHDVEAATRDSVVLRALLVPELEAENDRLRRSLGLGHSLGWGFVPAEALHSRALGEEFTITLTRGAQAGVRPFSPVVAPEGLVGMVETVDPTMSLAIIWAHPDFRVSAMAADGSAFGIVQAHLEHQPRAVSARVERRAAQCRAADRYPDRELRCRRRVPARHPGRHRDRRAQDDRGVGPHLPRAAGGAPI